MPKSRTPAGWGVVRDRAGAHEVDIRIGVERFRRSYPTKKLADEMLRELRRKKALGEIGVRAGDGPLYSEVIPRVLESYESQNLTPRTLASYKYDMTRVTAWWGERSIPETRRGDVEDWLRAMRKEKLSASTQRHALDRLSQVHAWALDHELIATLPCRVPRPSLSTVKPGPATPEDRLAVMLAAASPRGTATLLLAADAGLRRAEILGLSPEDVKLDSRVIRVMGKGRKERYLPVTTDRLWAALKSIDCDLQLGGSLTKLKHLARPAWKAAYPDLKRRQFPKLHQLRRRFTTRALGAPGAVADDVRRWLGHGDIRVTDRYNRERPPAVPESVRKALEGSGKTPGGHKPGKKKGTGRK